jgi:hypothetical protein
VHLTYFGCHTPTEKRESWTARWYLLAPFKVVDSKASKDAWGYQHLRNLDVVVCTCWGISPVPPSKRIYIYAACCADCVPTGSRRKQKHHHTVRLVVNWIPNWLGKKKKRAPLCDANCSSDAWFWCPRSPPLCLWWCQPLGLGCAALVGPFLCWLVQYRILSLASLPLSSSLKNSTWCSHGGYGHRETILHGFFLVAIIDTELIRSSAASMSPLNCFYSNQISIYVKSDGSMWT